VSRRFSSYRLARSWSSVGRQIASSGGKGSCFRQDRWLVSMAREVFWLLDSAEVACFRQERCGWEGRAGLDGALIAWEGPRSEDLERQVSVGSWKLLVGVEGGIDVLLRGEGSARSVVQGKVSVELDGVLACTRKSQSGVKSQACLGRDVPQWSDTPSASECCVNQHVMPRGRPRTGSLCEVIESLESLLVRPEP